MCIFTSVTQYQNSSEDFDCKSEGSHLLRDLKKTVGINFGGSPRHPNQTTGTSNGTGCCRGRRLDSCVCKTTGFIAKGKPGGPKLRLYSSQLNLLANQYTSYKWQQKYFTMDDKLN